MTKAKADAVMEMLSTCPVEVNVLVVDETGEPGPTEEPRSSIYGSCEEAEAAEEQRVQGSGGGGRGFSKGDGTECKRRGRGWSGVRAVSRVMA